MESLKPLPVRKGSSSGAPQRVVICSRTSKGQRVEVVFVNIERQRFAARLLGAIRKPIGGTGHYCTHQHVAIARRIFNSVARIGESVQCVNRRLWGVEPDAIGETTVFVGIVGEDQCDLAVFKGRFAELGPICGELCHECNTIPLRAIGCDGALGCVVEIGLSFEGDRARQDASIDFG